MHPNQLRILLAGLKLFGARGYHATNIREIASEAGMQSASLYSYFSAKEAILTELVFIGHDFHHQTLLTALLDSGPNPVDQLRSLMTAHVSSHCRYSDLAIVSNYERQHVSPELLAPANALRQRSVQLLVDIFLRGKQQGVFNLLDDATTLGALGSFGTGSLSWYRSNETDLTPDEIGAHYAALALRMVGVPDS